MLLVSGRSGHHARLCAFELCQRIGRRRGKSGLGLGHGAEAYGFRGEVWTCGRVARVLGEEFGVAYHPGHVSRILKALGWTPQIPIARAIQRDEEAIERWVREDWPALRQRARREGRTLVFVDESAFYLLPGRVRTYGPSGLRPILHEWQTHDHLSVMGA